MGAPERNRVLAGELVSRASVEAGTGASLADIDQAIAACDFDRAASLAIARVKGGEPVGTDVIARILPGIELPAMVNALVAITPERKALVDVVTSRAFPTTKDASELEAIVLYAAWRAGADPTAIIPHLRRLSARTMTAEGYALLATIAESIDDPNVRAATKPIASFAKEYARQVAADEKAMTASLDGVLASLPAEVESSRGGFTVRSTKTVGRNDPCPCGSGLKYKKCHADKDAVATPSPVPGLSWDEFLAGDKLTEMHVQALPLRDLVKVDLARLADKPLYAAFSRFTLANQHAHAERVVAEAERRGGHLGADMREALVHELLDTGRIEDARRHIGQLPEEHARDHALEMTIYDGPPEAAWHALVAAARTAVGSTDKLPDLELAYTLLRAEPALGIIAARACIGTLHVDDAALLLELVEEARDRLNLPPTDAAWDVLDALTEPQKKKHEGESDAQLKSSLAESSGRIDQLERALAQVRSELSDAKTRPAAELMRAPEQTSGLESKVRELEALIREGNAERRELRKQIEAATTAEDDEAPSTRRDGARARRTTLDEPDDDVGDELEPGARGIAIPRFERRVIDALDDVPANVASEAMRTVGTLAAGDGFAWRGVKAAKDMTRQVLMARVGIHHRLIFRVEDGALEVLDLITREQLLTTLKRLRANR